VVRVFCVVIILGLITAAICVIWVCNTGAGGRRGVGGRDSVGGCRLGSCTGLEDRAMVAGVRRCVGAVSVFVSLTAFPEAPPAPMAGAAAQPSVGDTCANNGHPDIMMVECA
ncbi:hypothetical protein MAR_000163, partial [Mya arenaria]